MAGDTAVKTPMNCPGCGRETGKGKAYCANPACVAAAGPPPPSAARSIKFNLDLDFIKLARLGAAAIAVLAAAYICFFVRF